MNGKGSRQRPTDKAKFDENFDRIFKSKVLDSDTPPIKDNRDEGDKAIAKVENDES